MFESVVCTGDKLRHRCLGERANLHRIFQTETLRANDGQRPELKSARLFQPLINVLGRSDVIHIIFHVYRVCLQPF